jgi:hypothetical protein
MIGEGIKQIPSYKCSLPFDELQKLKEEFWASKKEHRRVWLTLKSCCETDAGIIIYISTKTSIC